MTKVKLFTIICICFLLVFVYACNRAPDEAESSTPKVEQGEHEGEGERGEHEGGGERGEHEEGGEGEESGPRIPMDGIHNEVRKGSRLILSFDKESSSFIGTVENVSEKTLTRVRIEVHLSNGIELGPTEPISLDPGKKADVKLSAEGQTFEWWKAHAEVGESEHR